jgi:hypothetical protein
MSFDADKLLALATHLESLAHLSPEKNKEDQEWEKTHPKMKDWTDKEWSEYLKKQKPKDTHQAEDKKLDPKAKVRNRGTVCVPASSAKDKKDHYPINNIDQARNALDRVHQYSKVPSWYSGSLKSLQELVSRKVHSKYPSIGKEKKSSIKSLLVKYASVKDIAAMLSSRYPSTTAFLKDLAKAQFELVGLDPNNPDHQREEMYEGAKATHDAIMKFANEFEPLEASFF